MKRNDGRENSDIRKVEFVMNVQKDPTGSVIIRWGNTHVLCSVSVEEKAPHWLQGQGQGWITAEYGMLPGSTDKRMSRDRSRNNGRTHEIQRLIGRSLRNAIDLKSLGERTVSIDCDVLQADGGTRTASITGGCVAIIDAIAAFRAAGKLKTNPIKQLVASVSVGVYEGMPILDLDYLEDSNAETDMNIIMTEKGGFIELQGTAEKEPFEQMHLDSMLNLAKEGIQLLISKQKEALQL